VTASRRRRDTVASVLSPRALSSLTLAASLALSPSLLLAQTQVAATQAPTTPAAPGARVAEAQSHIVAAMAAFRAEHWQTAIREFEASYRAAPDADVWYNLARARERSGDLTGAIADFQRYLRDKVDAPDREDVQRTIRELQARVDAQAVAAQQTAESARVRLVLEGAPRNTHYFLDGRELPVTLDPRGVPTGEHAVRVTSDGTQEWAARVRVRQGETATVFAAPALATRYITRPRPHITSAVLLGLGAVSVGIAGFFAIRAVSEDCDACNAQVQASNRSDIFLGAGAGLVVGAAVAYFIERATGGTERVTSP
jgi:Tetratricopeptide repeat